MTYKYHKKTSEERREEINKITDRLRSGIEEYLDSDRYKELLDNFSKFPEYSLNNSLLIAMQKPEATMVAGYTQWKNDFHRQVNKGEKGIPILCPVPYVVKEEHDVLDPITQKPMLDGNGEHITEIKEGKKVGFKIGYTWDISQTSPIEGMDPINLDAVHDLQGNVNGYADLVVAIQEVAPVPMEFANFEGTARGYYSLSEKKIVIREGMSESQTLKTMIHETTHSILHTQTKEELKQEGKQPLPSPDKEIQAESVAYVVSKHYGLDTSEYSIPYVGTWAGDSERINQNLETIKTTSDKIINSMDAILEERQMEREQSRTHDLTANELATQLDAFSKEFDPYEYADTEVYKGSNFDQTFANVRHGNVDGIKSYLNEVVVENRDPTMSKKAASLIENINKYMEKFSEEIKELDLTRSNGIKF